MTSAMSFPASALWSTGRIVRRYGDRQHSLPFRRGTLRAWGLLPVGVACYIIDPPACCPPRPANSTSYSRPAGHLRPSLPPFFPPFLSFSQHKQDDDLQSRIVKVTRRQRVGRVGEWQLRPGASSASDAAFEDYVGTAGGVAPRSLDEPHNSTLLGSQSTPLLVPLGRTGQALVSPIGPGTKTLLQKSAVQRRKARIAHERNMRAASEQRDTVLHSYGGYGKSGSGGGEGGGSSSSSGGGSGGDSASGGLRRSATVPSLRTPGPGRQNKRGGGRAKKVCTTKLRDIVAASGRGRRLRDRRPVWTDVDMPKTRQGARQGRAPPPGSMSLSSSMSSLPVDGGSGPVESSFPPSREGGGGKPVPRWARYEDEVDEEEEAGEEALGLRREGADAPDEKEGPNESRDPGSTSLPPQPWGDEAHETKLMAGGDATGWGLADTGAKGKGLPPHHPSESLLRVTSPLRVPSPGTGPLLVPRLQFQLQPDTTTSGNDEGTVDHSSGKHSNGDTKNWPPEPHVGLGTDASRQGLPSPRFFALEMFDDQDDLEKDTHDFERRLSERAREMAAAPGAAVSAAAVGAANAADQRPFLPAQSTWNHLSGDREWRHCDVLEMDASSQRYLIRWGHNGKMKYVSRFNIIFDHEDRPTLDARTRRAKARREASEARSRYHFNLTALAQGMDLTEWAVPAEMMIAVLHRAKVDIGSLGLPIALSGEGDHPHTSLDAPLSSWSVGSERRPSIRTPTLGERSLREGGGRESSRPLATAASAAANTEADAAYIGAVLELTEEVRLMYIHDLQMLELQELVDSDDRYRGPRMAPPVRGLPTHRVLSRGGLSALRDALLLATPCDWEALIARGCRVASRLPIADPLVLKAMHLCSDVMERIRSMVH